MKNYFISAFVLLISFSIAFLCCKKKKVVDDNTNNNPIVCTLTTSTLVANDTIFFIEKDTAYATANNTFYTEHKISDVQGCSIEFEGSSNPVAGTYEITPVFNEVIPGSNKAYLQYYINGQSFNGLSGQVKVTGSGTTAILEFCKINFKELFGDEKIISMKSDSE
jgi:hypothetical protein